MRRAFTLIELCYVLAVIGILAAATIPTYDVLVRKAHSDEARSMLQAVANAELQHYRDHGVYLACGPTGDVPKKPALFPSAEPCWQALGMRVSGQVRYRYGVVLDGNDFIATAEGDLDRDGVPSRYSLHGHDLEVSAEGELE